MSKTDGRAGVGRVLRHPTLWGACVALALGAAACSSDDSPTSPSGTTGAGSVVTVLVTGPTSLSGEGKTGQYTAKAVLSSGSTEDRTSSATWQSSNGNVVSIGSGGLATARGEGSATITATIEGLRGTLQVSVKFENRTPDPAPGQKLPLPNVQAFIASVSPSCPSLTTQSCPQGIKYVNNPWQDCIVDNLRTLDTRWGYNAKPTRTPADNGGQPVVAAGDEVTYHYSAGPDQGSQEVYLIDLIESHCGSNPRLTWRDATGTEQAIWTGAGRF
jgi:hypothetical protein